MKRSFYCFRRKKKVRTPCSKGEERYGCEAGCCNHPHNQTNSGGRGGGGGVGSILGRLSAGRGERGLRSGSVSPGRPARPHANAANTFEAEPQRESARREEMVRPERAMDKRRQAQQDDAGRVPILVDWVGQWYMAEVVPESRQLVLGYRVPDGFEVELPRFRLETGPLGGRLVGTLDPDGLTSGLTMDLLGASQVEVSDSFFHLEGQAFENLELVQAPSEVGLGLDPDSPIWPDHALDAADPFAVGLGSAPADPLHGLEPELPLDSWDIGPDPGPEPGPGIGE